MNVLFCIRSCNKENDVGRLSVRCLVVDTFRKIPVVLSFSRAMTAALYFSLSEMLPSLYMRSTIWLMASILLVALPPSLMPSGFSKSLILIPNPPHIALRGLLCREMLSRWFKIRGFLLETPDFSLNRPLFQVCRNQQPCRSYRLFPLYSIGGSFSSRASTSGLVARSGENALADPPMRNAVM